MTANTPPTPRRTIGRPGPAEDGRMAILEAAGRAFATRGYLATSIDAIADELGATKGRVYHYYRGKAEVFLDVVVSGMNELIDEITPLATGPGTPPERLFAMAHRHAELMMIHHSPQRVSVQAVEMRTVPEIRLHSDLLDEVFDLRRRYEQLFVDIVEQGAEAGDFEVEDSNLAVKSALGSLNWIPIWYSPDRAEAEDVPRVAKTFATFIVNGLRKRS